MNTLPPATTSIWSFNRRLSQRLMLWSLFSIFAGLFLATRKDTARAFGFQFAGWGLVDAAIAFFGQRSAERKQAGASIPVELAHARSLRRALWFNTFLDLFYMAGGLFLVFGPENAAARKLRHPVANGLAIFVQGLFLFVFDLFHARRVPDVARALPLTTRNQGA